MLPRPTTEREAPPRPLVNQRAHAPVETDRHDRAAAPILPGTEWLVQAMAGPLRRMWSRGFRFLFVMDAVSLYGLMVGINLLRFGSRWPTYSASFYLAGFLIATAIHLVINYFCGLYEREPRLGRRPWLPRVIVAVVIGVGIQGLAFVFLDRYLMPRFNLVIFAVLGSLVLTANRRLSRRLANRRQGLPRVVLVGAPAEVALATAHIAASEHEVQLVGQVSDADSLTAAIDTGQGTDILLLNAAALEHVFPEPMAQLEADGIGFLQTVGARDTLLGLKSVREIAGMPFAPLRIHSIPTYKVRFKRLFDLVFLVVTAPITLLLLAVFALYVLLRDGRPVLYRQHRVGKDAKEFRVVKFRTMVRDAERSGARLASANDSRVVPGLGWMRSTRADELPQLWNVLRGEMSLVGPRPERPELTTDIQLHVAGWVMRHQLPPGLTGLAQVNGRYATSAEYKLGYDLQYIVNWSPVLDLQILAQTVWVVISRRV